MSDAQKTFGPSWLSCAGVRVGIGDVGDVVAEGFEPVNEGKLPEEKLSGADREWRVEDLTVFSVRAAVADFYAASPVPRFFSIVVQGELRWPAVVGLPRGIAGLEDEVGGTVITDDKDGVAFGSAEQVGEFSDVNTAWPVVWDGDGFARGPLAFAESVWPDFRVRLCDSVE